jgi:hypothetical protein
MSGENLKLDNDMPTIIQKTERERLCGYRKKGGIYLVSDGLASPCDKLPIPLTVCEFCGGGIKQGRGFAWIKSDLFESKYCGGACGTCPLSKPGKKMGLMWVGNKYYSSAEVFTKEAAIMGVSKRLNQIPFEFVIGETWVALAHPKAVVSIEVSAGGSGIVATPGIFHAFKPSRIEYVVTGNETEQELIRYEERGFTLVNVTPDKNSQQTINLL